MSDLHGRKILDNRHFYGQISIDKGYYFPSMGWKERFGISLFLAAYAVIFYLHPEALFIAIPTFCVTFAATYLASR